VKETAMISTLNELVAKEHTARLIEQANRWRFRQAARALLRDRSRRPASAGADPVLQVEVRDAVILDAAAVADAYCQRAAAPTRRAAA
jgi:hypothetical protein